MKAGIRSAAMGIVLTAVLACSVVVPQNRVWCISESGHNALEIALDGCEYSHFTHTQDPLQKENPAGAPQAGMTAESCEEGDCSDILLRVTCLPTTQEDISPPVERDNRSFRWMSLVEAAGPRTTEPAPSPPFGPRSQQGIVLLI